MPADQRADQLLPSDYLDGERVKSTEIGSTTDLKQILESPVFVCPHVCTLYILDHFLKSIFTASNTKLSNSLT